MIFPDEGQWAQWGVKSEIHKFFVLRWQELFDPNTYDSWQVRSSNIKTILFELLESIEVVKKVHAHHVNIDELINEAREVSRDDIILKESFPFISNCLDNLRKVYESDIKSQNKFNPNRFESLVRVALGNLDQYRDRLIDSISYILQESPIQYKKRLDSLISLFGIELKADGYSSNFLRISFRKLTDSHEVNFQERVDKFLRFFTSGEKEYECYCYVSWPGEKIEFSNHNIVITYERKGGAVSNEESQFYSLDKQSPIARIKLKSIEEFTASHLAREKLGSIFAISKLYNVTKKPSIRNYPSLIKLPDGTYKLIEQEKQVSYIRDSKNPNYHIEGLSNLIAKLSKSDGDQILASLQYHNLAGEAPTDEAKLVNLWIALESLVQDGGSNIIDRICKYIPDSNSTSYCYQLMKATPISFKKYWRNNDISFIEDILIHSNKYKLAPIDITRILTDEVNGDLICKFLAYCECNPLLIYRISNLWVCFSSPKNLSKRISSHHQRITWQIRRIYRARNQIMHRGSCSKDIRQLIQHLHSYYVLSIHNLIHDLKVNTGWCIRDALEYRKTLYDYFILRLKTTKEKPISIEMLLKPQLTLTTVADDPAWKGPS